MKLFQRFFGYGASGDVAYPAAPGGHIEPLKAMPNSSNLKHPKDISEATRTLKLQLDALSPAALRAFVSRW